MLRLNIEFEQLWISANEEKERERETLACMLCCCALGKRIGNEEEKEVKQSKERQGNEGE